MTTEPTKLDALTPQVHGWLSVAEDRWWRAQHPWAEALGFERPKDARPESMETLLEWMLSELDRLEAWSARADAYMRSLPWKFQGIATDVGKRIGALRLHQAA